MWPITISFMDAGRKMQLTMLRNLNHEKLNRMFFFICNVTRACSSSHASPGLVRLTFLVGILWHRCSAVFRLQNLHNISVFAQAGSI